MGLGFYGEKEQRRAVRDVVRRAKGPPTGHAVARACRLLAARGADAKPPGADKEGGNADA